MHALKYSAVLKSEALYRLLVHVSVITVLTLITCTVHLHRFVFVLLSSASPPLLLLNLPVPPAADSLTGTRSVSLFKALLSGQGNLSDSEKHSRKTLTPADQGDTLFSTA